MIRQRPEVYQCTFAGEKLSESTAADVRELCSTLLNCYLIQVRTALFEMISTSFRYFLWASFLMLRMIGTHPCFPVLSTGSYKLRLNCRQCS